MALLDGLIAQLEVVHALILRETRTRFGKSQLGYLWAFLEPLLWILTFHIMFTVTGRQPPYGMDMWSFIATGMGPYQLFREAMNRTSNAIDGNKALLYYPQIRPLDLVIARASLEGVTGLSVLLVLLGANALVTQHVEVQDPLAVLGAMTMSMLLGSGMGLTVGCIAQYNSSVARFVPALFRPMLWISGVFFTAHSLPSQIRSLMLWNPVLHILEFTRAGYFTSYEATHASASYVGIWVLATLATGLFMERTIRRRLEVT